MSTRIGCVKKKKKEETNYISLKRLFSCKAFIHVWQQKVWRFRSKFVTATNKLWKNCSSQNHVNRRTRNKMFCVCFISSTVSCDNSHLHFECHKKESCQSFSVEFYALRGKKQTKEPKSDADFQCIKCMFFLHRAAISLLMFSNVNSTVCVTTFLKQTKKKTFKFFPDLNQNFTTCAPSSLKRNAPLWTPKKQFCLHFSQTWMDF